MVVRDDIHSKLDPMDDEEAIAVLEGRLPAHDSLADQNAARMIADGLLNEPELQGGAVVSTEPRQPWMKMASQSRFQKMSSVLASWSLEKMARLG